MTGYFAQKPINYNDRDILIPLAKVKCERRELLCDNEIQCYHETWKCDSDYDCDDGSDEKDCDQGKKPTTFFMDLAGDHANSGFR